MGNPALDKWDLDRMKEHLDSVGVRWFKDPPKDTLADRLIDYLESKSEGWLIVDENGPREMTEQEVKDLSDKVQASDPERAAEVRRSLNPPVAADNPFAPESRKVVPLKPDTLTAPGPAHPASRAMRSVRTQ